jgi:hypothetical protein
MTTVLSLIAAGQLAALVVAVRRICRDRVHILRQGRALRDERAERARLAAQIAILEQREAMRQQQALHMTIGHTAVVESWRLS